MADYCNKCRPASRLTTCAKCKGKGTVQKGNVISGYREETCPVCNGTGKLCPTHGANWG